MSREYMTTVTILDAPEGIKPGLTAEALIVVNEIPNALVLPVQAVFEYGGKTYSITYHDGKWDKIEIKTGPSNDKHVVILEGLNEGDMVVLGAWAHREKVDLPKLKPEEENANGQQEDLEQPGRERSERPDGATGGPPGRGGPPRAEGGPPRGEGGSGGQRGGGPGGRRGERQADTATQERSQESQATETPKEEPKETPKEEAKEERPTTTSPPTSPPPSPQGAGT